MGNSEVGHLNLGAGAVVKQDLLRIDEAIEDGSFFENEVLREACRAERVHLLGLVSAGGVHASMDHLKALVELARREQVADVVIHAFTDGRDTLPDSGAGYIAEVEELAAGARIASVTGRYYAMDRDKRWDRTKLAYDAIVQGEAEFSADTGEAAVQGGLRARRDGRVHQADPRGRGGAHPRRRQRDLLQLPPRPRPAADQRARRRDGQRG